MPGDVRYAAHTRTRRRSPSSPAVTDDSPASGSSARNDTTEGLFTTGAADLTFRTAPTLPDIFQLLLNGDADVSEFGVGAEGILMDEYGFRPERNRWVIGGLDPSMPPFGFTTHPHPDDVEVTTAPAGKTLGGMLDALFTANAPQVVLDGSHRIRRLFPDHGAVERDY